MTAIYELEPIGVNGTFEANGVVHYYCNTEHAIKDAEEQGFTGPEYSKIINTDDALEGTECEYPGH